MYRTEHPNPQFERKSYECLNGKWEFETGAGEGKQNAEFKSKIEVPFLSRGPAVGDWKDGIVHGLHLRERDRNISR